MEIIPKMKLSAREWAAGQYKPYITHYNGK
jgi:hypothetical protein